MLSKTKLSKIELGTAGSATFHSDSLVPFLNKHLKAIFKSVLTVQVHSVEASMAGTWNQVACPRRKILD